MSKQVTQNTETETATVMTQEQVNEDRLARMKALPTTSARIRALHNEGFKDSAIVKYLNEHFMAADRPHPYRPQHVYNVLHQIVKRAS